MPLSCDCYGGCWGDHSMEWPSFVIPTSLIEKYEGHPFKAVNEIVEAAGLPYGSYVIDHSTERTVLRVESAESCQRAATCAVLLS